MKAINPPPLAALILKIVGIVLILLYLLDVVVLLSSAKFQDSQWLFTATTQLIDRGFVPMLGLAFLFAGFWIQDATANAPTPGFESARGLKLSALLLASALGLIFLLLVPLNVNATRAASDDQLKQVAQQSSQYESQLEGQIQQFKGKVDAQLNAIDQAIKSGQLQGDQLAQAQQQQEQLKKLKSDPKALEAQVAPERDRIRDNRQKAESQIRENALRSGMRSGLASLVMAVGYAIIGWTGLRQLLNSPSSRQTPSL